VRTIDNILERMDYIMINTNEFHIVLKNSLYNDSSISNVEVVILSLLNKNYNTAKEVSLCSVNILLDYMYCKHTNSRIAADIREGLANLIATKVIEIIDLHYEPIEFKDILNNNLFYVRIPKVLDTEGYFKILESDVDKIFKKLALTNINKFGLVRYFIAIQRVISNEKSFGWLPQSKVREFVGESKTVSKYNNLLMDELKLIRYNNNYITPERSYCSTYFGKYDDEVNFNRLLQNEVASKGLIPTTKVTSNARRRVKAKSNVIEKEIESTTELEKIQRLELELAETKKKYDELKFKGNQENIPLEGFTNINGTVVSNEPNPNNPLKVIKPDEEEVDFTEFMYPEDRDLIDIDSVISGERHIDNLENRIEELNNMINVWGILEPKNLIEEDLYIYNTYINKAV
jgi:hypothetical protein